MRTIQQIEDDLVIRLSSSEYIPQFLKTNNGAVSSDYVLFVTGAAKFLAPYIQGLETYLEIYEDEQTLRMFLENRGFYTSGVTAENLAVLQDRLQNQVDQLCARGTMVMLDEVRQMCGDIGGTPDTDIIALSQSECGWWAGFTSPEYVANGATPQSVVNFCYLDLDQIVMFYLHNYSNRRTNEKLQEILQRYFEPKHVQTVYYFV
jgi:hypothetical protein